MLAVSALAETGQVSISSRLLFQPVYLTNQTQILVNLTNSGDVNLTNLTIEDRYNQAVFLINTFSQPPTFTNVGFVRFDNLINTNIGASNSTPLAPNQSVILLLNYTPRVNDSAASHILNGSALAVFNATTTPAFLPVTSNVVTLSTPVIGDAFEPDDNLTSAKPISLDGVPQVHAFAPVGDMDFLNFSARAGSIYDISVLNLTPFYYGSNASNTTTDALLAVFNSSGGLMVSNDDTFPPADLNPRLVWIAPVSGTYYIRVSEARGSPGGPGGMYQISAFERGRLSPVTFSLSKTSMLSQDNFSVTASFKCVRGACPDVVLALDPEEPALPGSPSPAIKQASASPSSIDEIAARQGSAKVIVKTRSPQPSILSRMLSKQGPSPLTAQAIAKSAEIQAQVSSSLPSGSFTRSDSMPALDMMSGEVTSEGLAALRADPAVEEVYPDLPVRAFLDGSGPRIRADLARNITVQNVSLDGAGIGVCVIDTGVAYNHSDFGSCSIAQVQSGSCPAVLGGYDFVNSDNDPMDDNGHGSHVAGIVASRDPSYRGVAPKAGIVAIKVLDADGFGSDSNVIAGINWCVTNASRFNISVISISLGNVQVRPSAHCDRQNPNAPAINSAVQAGILVSVASGNLGFGTAGNDGMASPACVQNSTSVGSTQTKTDLVSSFTNRDALLDILAPGEFINSTLHNSTSGHISLAGTSMATPQVSGVAALIYQKSRLSYNRSPSASEVKTLLKSTGVQVMDSPGTGVRFPRVDALGAVSAKGLIPTVSGALPFWTSSQNPVQCGSLAEDQVCSATWQVNASVSSGTFEFFAIASQLADQNATARVNVTVLAGPPSFTIQTVALPQPASMGSRVNVTINLTNTGRTPLTNASVAMAFNVSDLIFDGASPAPSSQANSSGALVWANPFSSLAPNVSFFINVSFGAKNRSSSNSINSTITVSGNATDGLLPAAAGSSTALAINAFNLAPVITTSPILAGAVGASYSYDVNASDENGDTVSYSLVVAPSGMAISSSTGLVTWTPAVNQSGSLNVTVNASDGNPGGALAASQSFVINVTAVNQPPVVNSSPPAAAAEDSAYSYAVNASDPENGTLFYLLAIAPSGMSINNATGVIAWVPINNQVGVNPARVDVSDPLGNLTSQSFTVTVSNVPSIFNTTPPSSAVATRAFVYDANSSDDGQGNITYALITGPAGMAVGASTGVISWLPSASNLSPVVVNLSVNDGNGGVTLQSFIVNVSSPFSTVLLGPSPSSVNMSGQLNVTILMRNAGNLSLDNVSFLVRFNASDLAFQSNGVLAVNGAPAGALVLSRTQGNISAANLLNLSPLGNASVVISFVVANRTSNTTTIITSSADSASNGTVLVDNQSSSVSIVFVNFIPVFTTAPPSAGIVTTIPFGYDADAYDGNGDNLTFSLTGQPSGMAVNASTGVVNWTSSLFQTGVFNVTLTVSDGSGGSAAQSIYLNVTRYDSPPNITTSPPTNATEDSLFAYDVNASDAENDTLAFALDRFPDGMTIGSSTGLISWTPNNTQVGNATVRVNVSDGMGNLSQQAFALIVLNNPPMITTSAPVTGVHGVAYVYAPASTDDGQGAIVYNLAVQPAGMSINASSGLIAWIPSLSQIGLNAFTLRVSDGNGGIAEQNVTVNVSSALLASSSALPNPLSMNQPVQVRVNASSVGNRSLGNVTLSVRFNSSDIIFLNASPSAVSNSSANGTGILDFGVISSALAHSQSASVLITFLTQNRSLSANTSIAVLFNATDNGTIIGQNTTQQVEVSFANFAPQIVTSPITSIIYNTTYAYDVDAVDGNGDLLNYTLSAAPPGMAINSTTGVIAWLANITGNQSVSILVSDGRGGSAFQGFTLEVRTINLPPSITTVPILIANESVAYVYDVNATDSNNDTLVFSLITGPSGMAINSATGVITFLPVNSQVGSVGVTVRVADPSGANDSQSYTLLIVNRPPSFTTAAPLAVVERANYTYDANSSDDASGVITYYLDLSPSGMAVNATSGAITWSPSTSQAGPNNVSLRVGDGNGGFGVQNFTITVSDITPPNLTITAPANGSVFNASNVTVALAVSDNGGIASCAVLVNGTSATLFSASAGLNKTQAPTGTIALIQGQNNLTARCTDSSGLSNHSAMVLVFADSLPPSVTISSPVNGANVTANFTLSYSVSDATLDKVRLVYNAQTSFINASGPLTVTGVAGLNQTLTIYANDSVGFVTNASIRFNVDLTPPTAAIGAAASVLISGSRSAVVNVSSVNSSDNLGIAAVAWDFDAADGIGNVESSAQNASRAYSAPGTYLITLAVMDISGYTTRANATVLVARDSDVDGFPDEPAAGQITDTCPFIANASNSPARCAGDADGDGTNDTSDFIVGNITQLGGNLATPALLVGASTNPGAASGIQTVTITSGGAVVFSFTYNFTNLSTLVVPNITVIRQSAGILIAGLPPGINKTVTLQKDFSSHNAVCVRDLPAQSFAEISSSCTGSGEIQVNCSSGGSASQGKSCTDSGSSFAVTNLANTIVTSFSTAPPATPPPANGTLVNNGTAIQTEPDSPGGGTFKLDRGSSGSGTPSSASFTPPAGVPLPATRPASSDAKPPAEDAVLVVKNPPPAGPPSVSPKSEIPRADDRYRVSSSTMESDQVFSSGFIIVVFIIGLALMSAVVLVIVWALKR